MTTHTRSIRCRCGDDPATGYGNCRVIYAVSNEVVTVLAIGHRREIYD